MNIKKAATQNLNDSICLVTGKSIAKRHPFKLELALLCLLRAGKHGVNQPELNQAYGESCTHTVMSTLQNNRSIQIARRSETWGHRHGGKTFFNRYWLADGKAEILALCLLNHMRSKRGMYPIKPGEYFTLPNKAA